MATFHGTKHDDTFDKSSDTTSDTFDLFKGGNDTVIAGSGDDLFRMGASLNAGDRLDGGAGRDTVFLHGDYSAGLTLGDQTLQNIEVLRFGGNFSYNLTMADGNVAAGTYMSVNATALGAVYGLTFDASAETDGHYIVYGGAGDDTLTGGALADKFRLEAGGNDIAHGGGGNDVFVMGTALTAADTIDGGAGNDIVRLSGGDDIVFGAATLTSIETLALSGGSYDIATVDATVALNANFAIDASALGASDTLTFDGSAETDGRFQFDMGANFRAGDHLVGGTGFDTLVLSGDYSTELDISSAMIVSINDIVVEGAHAYNLKIADDTVVGTGMVIDAGISSGGLTFDGSAETASGFIVYDSSGDDAITTGGGADQINLERGGVDTVHAGNGGDAILANGTLTAADTIDGGAGSDTLVLDGDYSAGLVFGAATITSIEEIDVTSFHSYNLTTNDGNVAALSSLTVNASNLLAADTLTFDGSAETDGSFSITDGAGNDVLTGGAQADTFFLQYGGNDTVHGGGGNDSFFVFGTLTAADEIDGGTGSNQLHLFGDYTGANALVMGATTVTNVSSISFALGFSYDITTNDATVAAGQTLQVNNQTNSGDTVTFDGSAETDGHFSFLGGPGTDNLTGGALFDTFNLTNGGTDTVHGGGGDDTITFASSFSVSDIIDGGAGNDTVTLNNIAGPFNFAATTITNVEDLVVKALSNISITTNDANVAAGTTLTVDFSPSNPISADFTFDGSAETDGHFNIIAPTGSIAVNFLSLTGGALSDSFTLGNDGTPDNIINGGGGDDTLTMTAPNQVGFSFDGGADNDTIAFTGGGTVDGNISRFTNTENLVLDDHNWNVSTLDFNVANGATLTVDATALVGPHSITFNGSAETDGSFGLKGGSGDDTLIGGSLADNFLGGFGADTLTGGGGADVFFYTAAIQSTSTIHDTITDFAAGTDKFDLATTVTQVYSASGSLDSGANFDSQLAALNVMHVGGATEITVTGGTLNGHIILIVDGDGNAQYNAGSDYVIDITGHTGTLTTGDFI